MGKYRYLFKNIGLLTLSNFGTKLLSFLFVPLYTNILTTSEYGTYDLFNTTVGILIPILTLNVMESVLRFSIDNSMDRTAIFTIGMRYLFNSSIIIVIFLGINHMLGLVEIIDQYSVYFALMYFSQALSGIVISFARGSDRIADISVSSILSTITMIISNILFLVYFKWGLLGYCLANILAVMVQCVYILLRMKFWKYINIRRSYQNEKKEMLTYCKPLIANSIAWWVNNASDRYIIIWMCGLAENGIYSVASKIPSILNIFQSIFNQAWTLSAVKDYNPDDEGGFFSTMYNSYNCMMVLVCSALIVINRVLAKFLYAKDFYVAWRYVPFLLIAILFGSLSGYLGGIFSAVKDSKIFAKSTVYGALSNIVLNILLVPNIGALGAAIATAICYWVVWFIRVIQVRKYIKIEMHLLRDYIVYGILVLQSIAFLLYTEEAVGLYVFEVVMCVLILILFYREIKEVMKKIVRVLIKR